MPRVARANKQKNKKFKGSKSTKTPGVAKKTTGKTKAIAKGKQPKKTLKQRRIKEESTKKERQVQRITSANEYLDATTKDAVAERLKAQNEVRIVLLIPCNENADVAALLSSLAFHCEQDQAITIRKDLSACSSFPALQIFPGAVRSPIRNRLFVVGSQREPRELIDLAKSADIVCPVLSALSADAQRITQDPLNYGGAFDEAGYATINLLRSLGLPRVVGLLQHLDRIQPKHQQKIERFYSRFVVSEFGDEKCLSVNQGQLGGLLRVLDSCSLVGQSWKSNRGYLLADQVEVLDGKLAVSGFLKGSCINANQLAHLTNFDDYAIQRIEILPVGGRLKFNATQEQLVQYQTVPDELCPFSKPETHDDGDILSAIQGLKLAPEEQQKLQQQQSEDQGMEDEDEDEEDESQANWQDAPEGEKAEQRAKRVEMQMRGQDELQFQDEVEYAAQELLREKYRQYQGLKSFKTSQWNELENLPSEYDRIFFFKHYAQTQRAAIKDNLARGFAYPGFYVRVTLVGVDLQKVSEYARKMPLMLSFLLKHERKMTVLHGKVQVNPHYEGEADVNSNEQVMVSVGFRRLLVAPLFSRCINGTEKTKFTKRVGSESEGYFFCSFYGLNHFPPSPFLVFRVNPLFPQQIEGAPLLKGSLAKCDPHHIILERIILTGYPFKINRRRSTVRFMFFNPSDVKYFRPIEVRTKLGLRGKIEQSLGTHGLMKVLFNEHIKHNDTVCMHLYRRVFPASF